MQHPPTHPERAEMSTAFTFQRYILAASIILGPATVMLFVYSWPAGLLRAPILATAQAGPVGNTLHFIGGVAASFFLPVGYLGMSLLGMRRAPWLATICAALSLVGWIPWAALMGIDDLGLAITQAGSTPQLAALWAHFNSDTVMSTYLLIYVIGHMLSSVLIGILLVRLRRIPVWAGWAFALSGPLKILLFVPSPILAIRSALTLLVFALWIGGAIPAALAMFNNREPETPASPTSKDPAHIDIHRPGSLLEGDAQH